MADESHECTAPHYTTLAIKEEPTFQGRWGKAWQIPVPAGKLAERAWLIWVDYPCNYVNVFVLSCCSIEAIRRRFEQDVKVNVPGANYQLEWIEVADHYNDPNIVASDFAVAAEAPLFAAHYNADLFDPTTLVQQFCDGVMTPDVNGSAIRPLFCLFGNGSLVEDQNEWVCEIYAEMVRETQSKARN